MWTLAVFMVGTDYISSAGRRAAMAFGILASALTGVMMMPTSMPAFMSVGVVDMRSGDLLWFSSDIRTGSANLRDPAVMRSLMEGLFATYPGAVQRCDMRPSRPLRNSLKRRSPSPCESDGRLWQRALVALLQVTALTLGWCTAAPRGERSAALSRRQFAGTCRRRRAARLEPGRRNGAGACQRRSDLRERGSHRLCAGRDGPVVPRVQGGISRSAS